MDIENSNGKYSYIYIYILGINKVYNVLKQVSSVTNTAFIDQKYSKIINCESSVTWSFRNNSNMLFCSSIIIGTQLLILINVENSFYCLI